MKFNFAFIIPSFLGKLFIRIILVLTTLLSLLSCGGDDRNILVTMELQADLEIPAGLNNLETHFFILRDQITNSKVFLQNLNNSDISEILPASASLSSRNTIIDYALIDRVVLRAISTKDQTVAREIFYMEFIPLNHNGDLNLFGSLSDVKDILIEDRFHLEVGIRFRNFTPTSFNNRIFMNFNVYGQ